MRRLARLPALPDNWGRRSASGVHCTQLGCGRLGKYPGQVAAYASGFAACLGGDISALCDQAEMGAGTGVDRIVSAAP
jgi:hypothetical protein